MPVETGESSSLAGPTLPEIRPRVKRKTTFPLTGRFAPIFRPLPGGYPQPQGAITHDREQFGTEYGPALQRGDKTACIVSLQAEIDRLGGVPYGWMRIYEILLFAFYNPRTGQCFPSHKAIAIKARCGVRTVQRALKWARDNNLIQWAHGLARGEDQQPLCIRRVFDHAQDTGFYCRL